jgi:transposase
VEVVAVARRVTCPSCGPTVAAVPWARHASSFTRAFEDLVVHDAIVGNKQAAADRYGTSWRAVNNMCVRVATEALGRVIYSTGSSLSRSTRSSTRRVTST